MNTRSTFAKSALTAVAGVMALGSALAVPSFAAAQQSGSYDSRGYYYDPCKRDQTTRSTTGGIIGALAGAAIGSNVAARNARTEGAVLGGLLGAGVGAGVGHSAAACRSQAQRDGYYSRGQSYGSNGYYDRNYYDRSYYDRDPAYDRDYDRSAYAGGGYRDYDEGYAVADRPADANGCTLAESPIYLPDGRVQKRFVRVCKDSSGRYQVVE